jgi:hypothetical protein
MQTNKILTVYTSDILFKNLVKQIIIIKKYYAGLCKVDLRISEKDVIMFVKNKDILNNP